MKSALVTGANGDVGRALIGSLASRYDLHLATWEPARDMPPAALPPGSSVTCVDIQDLDALTAAMKGITAVVHLAGQREFTAGWAALRGPNIDGVYNLFEAARRNNVAKVVLASSNHATGYLDEHRLWPIAGTEPPRPDSLYGVTKAFGEVFGRYASDYYGMSVICLRLGWVLERPHNEMALRMWLSHDDLGRLVIGALESGCRYGVYFGVSANRRRQWDLTDAERDLGYVPRDDSEQFAAELGLLDPGRDSDEKGGSAMTATTDRAVGNTLACPEDNPGFPTRTASTAASGCRHRKRHTAHAIPQP